MTTARCRDWSAAGLRAPHWSRTIDNIAPHIAVAAVCATSSQRLSPIDSRFFNRIGPLCRAVITDILGGLRFGQSPFPITHCCLHANGAFWQIVRVIWRTKLRPGGSRSINRSSKVLLAHIHATRLQPCDDALQALFQAGLRPQCLRPSITPSVLSRQRGKICRRDRRGKRVPAGHCRQSRRARSASRTSPCRCPYRPQRPLHRRRFPSCPHSQAGQRPCRPLSGEYRGRVRWNRQCGRRSRPPRVPSRSHSGPFIGVMQEPAGFQAMLVALFCIVTPELQLSPQLFGQDRTRCERPGVGSFKRFVLSCMQHRADAADDVIGAAAAAPLPEGHAGRRPIVRC